MINPVWLRTFCTLAEEGHFTRTAERLNITQPGVSQHLNKLEELFGRELIRRQGKQFQLTDAGERLFREAKEILLSLSNLEQRIGLDPAYDGVVRIKSPGSVGLKLYPQLLLLQKRHPKLVIDFRFAPNCEIEESISDGSIDIGFTTRPSTSDEVETRPLAQEALLLVTPLGISIPSWEILLELGFIGHPDGAHHASLLLSANYPEFQNSAQFKSSGFSNQIGLILEPITLGLGFTVLPRHAVEAFQKHHQLQSHCLDHPVSETLYLGTNRRKYLPNRVLTVIRQARELLAD